MSDPANSETVGRVIGILEAKLGVDISSADVDLLDSGTLDSLGLIEVMAELESAFGVEIPLHSLEFDDLRTAVSLARLVSVRDESVEPDSPTEPLAAFPLPGGGEIKPMKRDDLPEVAALLVKVTKRSGSADVLADFLSELFFDHPQADPGIPALIASDQTGRLIGFIGSNTRLFEYKGSQVRMGCSGPLIVDPESRKFGIGAFLMERYLAGPQDFSITDGATDLGREMWTGLGGQRVDERARRWTVVMRPMTFAHSYSLEKRALGERSKGLAILADRVLSKGSRWLLPARSTLVAETLVPRTLVEAISTLSGDTVLKPAYDEDFLKWEFDALGRVGKGELRGALFRDDEGVICGWYLYLLGRGSISRVLQIGGKDPYLEDVFSHLLHDAYDNGAALVDGRWEHHLSKVVGRRGILLRRHSTHPLVHSPDPELLRVLLGSTSF